MIPSSVSCTPPAGWMAYTVLPGNSLDGLALRYKTTSAAINQGNCLSGGSLLPGSLVYLPPLPTKTPVPCGAPHTWILYVVQPGDTLYHLGLIYGIPYQQIQRANCLTGIGIQIGQRLYVPPWAPVLPTATYVFETSVPTDTPTFYLPFITPPTDTPTFTISEVPTGTLTTP